MEKEPLNNDDRRNEFPKGFFYSPDPNQLTAELRGKPAGKNLFASAAHQMPHSSKRGLA
jgi:hypothetical protein